MVVKKDFNMQTSGSALEKITRKKKSTNLILKSLVIHKLKVEYKIIVQTDRK
jgi:hypothetical protein